MKFDKKNKTFLDYEAAMVRLFNDEQLFEQAIQLFLSSPILANLNKSYSKKDYEQIFQYAHELKGACANLSLTALYEASGNLTEAVRNGVTDVAEFERAYSSCIEAYNQTLKFLTTPK